MDYNTLLDQPFLKDLKCSLCENYLSYFPIHSTIDDQNICGRCTIPDGSSFVENVIYEVVAAEVEFPCRYMTMGCIERKCPKEMSLHENWCSYRSVVCPANKFDKCNDTVVLTNLEQHCKDNHSDFVLKDGEFSLDLSKSQTSNYILINNNTFFTFVIKYDCESRILDSLIGRFEHTGDINYKLSLNYGVKSFTITGCLADEEDVNKIYIDSYKISNDSHGSGKISLYENNSVTIVESKLSQELVQLLTCQECQNYVMPPKDDIFQRMTLCSSCDQDRGHLNNHFFGEIAAELNYPCKYHRNGCSFTSRPSLMKNHQLHCPYAHTYCPLNEIINCQWNGLKKNHVEHINECHTMTNVSIFETDRSASKFSLIKFSKYFFLLRFSPAENSYRWSVQMIGEFVNGFKYELRITDQNNEGRRLVTVQHCFPQTQNKDQFADPDQYCYYNHDQVRSYLNKDYNNNLRYTIRIFK